MYLFRHIQQIRGMGAALILAACVVLGACDSCKQEPKEEPPPVVDTGGEEADTPKEDPLAEAREQAEQSAESSAIVLGDRAREVAAEIEAQAAQADRPKPPSKPRPAKSGTIDAKAVQKVFAANQTRMQKCYERALKLDRFLQGKVRLSVKIGSDGRVQSTSTSGSLGSDAVTECMERQAMAMKFPKPQGGSVVVNKSYAFFPQN